MDQTPSRAAQHRASPYCRPLSWLSSVVLVASMVACGSSKSSAPPQPLELSGTYDTDAAGAGNITEITFADPSNYSLLRSGCGSDGTDTCPENGTYVFDSAHDSLALTDAVTGQTTTLPLQVLASTPASPESLHAPSLHPLGGGLTGDGGSLVSGGTSALYQITHFLLTGQGAFHLLGPAPTGLGPDPKGTPTKYPIVLVHGFASSPSRSFYKVADALRADGHKVYEPALPPFDTPQVRAKALAPQIDMALSDSGAQKVNIIAHSMGGLDSRELIDILGYGDRVASVTTMATPHRGSYVADVILGLVTYSDPSGSADVALNALATALGQTFNPAATDSHVRDTLTSLAEATAPSFNASHPDDPRVYYQSWTGVSSVAGVPNSADSSACGGNLNTYDGRTDFLDLVLIPAAPFVGHGTERLPADGIVMVSSAQWGVFRGCYAMSHWSVVGQTSLNAPTRTGWDHTRFYRDVAFELAAKGY
jgi:triacylglycerol lipase